MIALPAPLIFGGISGWLKDVVETLGYPGVAVLVLLESVFPPIPSELFLPLAGFLAGEGRFWLPGVIAAATAGSLAGALLLYGVSARLKEERVRGLLDRYGALLRLSGRDLDRADEWFDRHGGEAVIVGHMVPLVRSAVSIPAGFRRMPRRRFLLYTTIGSGVWNSLLIGLGWVLGDRWQEVSDYARFLEFAVLAAIAGGAGWLLWKRRRGSTPHATPAGQESLNSRPHREHPG